jgi:hypothetical protein
MIFFNQNFFDNIKIRFNYFLKLQTNKFIIIKKCSDISTIGKELILNMKVNKLKINSI